jgi:hypothetical protein
MKRPISSLVQEQKEGLKTMKQKKEADREKRQKNV